jgi:hypothetical protein
MCTPLPVDNGQFDSQQWVLIGQGDIVQPTTSSNTTITYNAASPELSIQVGNESPSNVPVSGADHVYFMRFGTQNNVLVLNQGTDPSTHSIYFISIWFYCATSNTVSSIYGQSDMSDMPQVSSSKGIGSLFFLTYAQQTNLFGVLYRADNGTMVGPSFQIQATDGPLIASAQGNTTILIFKQMVSGPNEIGNPTIPCILPINDFYVRDWTDSATSGDDGSEPSTHPVFYETSDVWNRQSLGDGFPTATKQPASEDAIAGQTNYAYTRVWRKEAGLSDVDTQVQATYYTAVFGSGNNFSTITQETIDFPGTANTGPIVSPGNPWTAPAAVSPHYCMAVAISTPNDPMLENLDGYAPGSGVNGADSQILDENNKAQRNMAVISVPHPPIPVPHRQPKNRITFYAIIHNPSVISRDMKFHYETSTEVFDHLSDMRIEIVGSKSRPFHSGETLILPNVQPGENRWVGWSFEVSKATKDKNSILPVYFEEMVGKKVINGFVIAALFSTIDSVIKTNLILHRSAVNRIHHVSKDKKVMSELAMENQQHDSYGIDDKTYMDFLRLNVPLLEESITRIVDEFQTADPFGITGAIGSLAQAINQKEINSAAASHTAALNKIDSFMTMIQLSQGNRADILQNVRWQQYLFSIGPKLKKLDCAEIICEKSENFIYSYSKSKNKDQDFVSLMKELIIFFHKTAEVVSGGKEKLKKDVEMMEFSLNNAISLQKVHREYLLQLQAYDKGVS